MSPSSSNSLSSLLISLLLLRVTGLAAARALLLMSVFYIYPFIFLKIFSHFIQCLLFVCQFICEIHFPISCAQRQGRMNVGKGTPPDPAPSPSRIECAQGIFHFAPNTQCPLTIPCLLHRELHCSTSPFLRKEGLCCPFETFSRSVAILSSSPPQAQPICIATCKNLGASCNIPPLPTKRGERRNCTPSSVYGLRREAKLNNVCIGERAKKERK